MRGMHLKEPYVLYLKIVIAIKSAEVRRQVIEQKKFRECVLEIWNLENENKQVIELEKVGKNEVNAYILR